MELVDWSHYEVSMTALPEIGTHHDLTCCQDIHLQQLIKYVNLYCIYVPTYVRLKRNTFVSPYTRTNTCLLVCWSFPCWEHRSSYQDGYRFVKICTYSYFLSAAPVGHQSTGTMSQLPIQSHYSDTEVISHCHIQVILNPG